VFHYKQEQNSYIPCGLLEYFQEIPPKCAAPRTAPAAANFLDSLMAFN